MPLHIIPELHRATHQVGVHITATDFGEPVSQAEAHILSQLAYGDASIAELHQSFGHKRSTLTSILNRLEGRGLIERSIHPTDRRSYMIALTDIGEPVAAAVRKALEKLERRIRKRLGGEAMSTLTALLAAIAEAAEAD